MCNHATVYMQCTSMHTVSDKGTGFQVFMVFMHDIILHAIDSYPEAYGLMFITDKGTSFQVFKVFVALYTGTDHTVPHRGTGFQVFKVFMAL